jgi:hypothetical protein
MENITPKVGMGATIVHWTDRTACTIISISTSGREVRVQQDHAKRVDKNGMSECQNYEYSPDPDGSVSTFTLRKNGRYIEKGAPMRSNGLAIGHRRQYHDYSF